MDRQWAGGAEDNKWISCTVTDQRVLAHQSVREAVWIWTRQQTPVNRLGTLSCVTGQRRCYGFVNILLEMTVISKDE